MKVVAQVLGFAMSLVIAGQVEAQIRQSSTNTLPTSVRRPVVRKPPTPTTPQQGSNPATIPSQSGSLTIKRPPTITTPSPLPEATVGASYSRSFAATGGRAPYTFLLENGILPGGLAIKGSNVTGTLTGEGGAGGFIIKLIDSGGATATKTFSIPVNQPPQIAPAWWYLGEWPVNKPLSSQFGAVCGTKPYTFSLATGTLPPGLSFSGATLSGTPTKPGAWTFEIKATDANGAMATRNYTVAISSGTSSTKTINIQTDKLIYEGPLPWASGSISTTKTISIQTDKLTYEGPLPWASGPISTTKTYDIATPKLTYRPQ